MTTEPIPKHRDETWDFRDANTKEWTHCFHMYPAMMIPQIARTLLLRHGVKGGWLLDPYCGTGTSLVEASIFGMHSVGCDINPLARLIATAKTSRIPLGELDRVLNDLQRRLLEIQFGATLRDVPIPDFPNRDYWFSEQVARELAFSETVRESSYTRNGEFKLFRMAPAQMERFQPDVFGTFQSKLRRNRNGLAAYFDVRVDVETHIADVDTARGETPLRRPENGFDLVITSPPYGDSQTTVAYGQFSRLAAEWIGLPEPRSIDRRSLGGRVRETKLSGFGPVDASLQQIHEADPKRARQVAAFYADLERSIGTVASMLSNRATVCYVVGDRRVKGVTLPTDEFIVYAFGHHGFRHDTTIVRNIPNKRMPSKNSPSNVPGVKGVTMHEEYIVVCCRS